MAETSNYIKGLAKRIVENSYHDKSTNTLFVTNPGISAQLLKSLATKNNFKIGSTKSGEYISIPLSYKSNEFEDKYVSQFDAFLDTYTYFNRNYHTLLTAYKTFDLMEENMSEVELILSTYVEEVLSAGFIEEPLSIKISNAQAQDLVEKILRKNKIYARLPMIVRNLAKYGNMGFTLSYPYLEANKGCIDDEVREIDVLRDLIITPVNPKFFKVVCDNHYNVIHYQTSIDNTYSYTNATVTVQNQTWQPWQFVHFLLPSEMTQPYGQSMLWSMRSAFDQLTTLESLLGISRASKIQRLVISIPMPQGISTIDAYQYMNEFKGNYLNSLFSDAPGIKAGRKIPGAMSIFVKPAIEGFDIDHIESNIDLADTEDVEYFLDKILRNSKLPKGYLVGEDTITTAQTLESQDLKFSRALIPLKQGLLNGITYMVECILTHAGFDVSKIDVDVTLNKPIQVSSDLIAKYADIVELIVGFNGINQMTKLNQYQAMVELGIPPMIAKLVNSGTSMPLTKDTDDLKNFMVGQTIKSAGEDMTPDGEDQFPAMESVKPDMRVKSKHFLAENHALTEALHDIRKQIKGTTSKRTLFENIMTPKATPKEEQ